ncbi:hypothetical protein D3C74_200000 [compost metagenome]
MAAIGNVQEIKEIRNYLDKLKQNGIIMSWELPYENLLTRLSAAIFFFTLTENANLSDIKDCFKEFNNVNIVPHEPGNISQMPYKIIFDQVNG